MIPNPQTGAATPATPRRNRCHLVCVNLEIIMGAMMPVSIASCQDLPINPTNTATGSSSWR